MTPADLDRIAKHWTFEPDASLDDPEEYLMEAMDLIPQLIAEVRRLRALHYPQEETS